MPNAATSIKNNIFIPDGELSRRFPFFVVECNEIPIVKHNEVFNVGIMNFPIVKHNSIKYLRANFVGNVSGKTQNY